MHHRRTVPSICILYVCGVNSQNSQIGGNSRKRSCDCVTNPRNPETLRESTEVHVQCLVAAGLLSTVSKLTLGSVRGDIILQSNPINNRDVSIVW